MHHYGGSVCLQHAGAQTGEQPRHHLHALSSRLELQDLSASGATPEKLIGGMFVRLNTSSP